MSYNHGWRNEERTTTVIPTMADSVDDILDSLRLELDKFADIARAAGAAGEEAKAEATERMKEALGGVRATLDRVERGLKSGAKTADEYVRNNPWIAIGAVAVVAFLLGAASGRRR
jgi:ElaB/YqjD/DUF883 family membrane-anchored ribosome-binding protein